MRTFVSLKLGSTPVPSLQILDEAFTTIAAMLEAAGETVPVHEALADIEKCRLQLAEGAHPEVLEPLARACYESTRALAAQAGALNSAQRAQIASLIATIRETMSTISGNEESLQDTLTGSADRFEKIAAAGTLQQMQDLLASEVSTLRRLSAERRAMWEQTTEQFRERLARLETRLDHTKREASVDALTNVANRRTFDEALRERLQPNKPHFVMAMIDVDEFKTINDRCGHAVGDHVLVMVAATLTGGVRGDDLVARLGGDEFAVLMTGPTLRQAETLFATIGKNVRDACRALVPAGMHSTISIGLAEYSAGETPESLVKRADMALYEAKRAGKGRVAVHQAQSIRELLQGSGRRRRL